MWLIPLLVIGVFVVAASKSPRESRPLVRRLAAPPAQPALQLPPVPGSVPPPGPIAVLGEVLRIGQYPAPTVILCAIAEAEALGRADLASDIVRVFVAPVVYQHWAIQGRPSCAPLPPAPYAPVPYERGSCRLSCAPRAQDYGRGSGAPGHERGSCAPRSPVAAPVAPPAQSVPGQVETRQADSDEILEMLHADPKAFVAMVEAQQARRGPQVEVFPVGTRPPTSDTDQASSPAPVFAQEVGPTAEPPGTSPEAGLQAAADHIRGMMPGSPIGGVPDDAWRQFVSVLEREPPTFSSSRHVGQYRQHRERLAALGIDPNTIHGSPVAQRMALDADLSDSYHHASAGGLTACLGRLIIIPGQEAPQPITLSGLLGVIQCAGLDGTVGWLERSSDRRRYPHTTQVFLNTNGVF